MKKTWISIALAALFLALVPYAFAQTEGKFAVEVEQIVASQYADAQLEDYLEILGTPSGDYGIAALRDGETHLLLLFHEDGDSLPHEPSWNALPQGDGAIRLSPYNGESDVGFSFDGQRPDAQSARGFTAEYIDPQHGDQVTRSISYRWRERSPWESGEFFAGDFVLACYTDSAAFDGTVFVDYTLLTFVDAKNPEPPVRIQGRMLSKLPLTLILARFEALPKTPEQARELIAGALEAKNPTFPPSRLYPVYCGPGEAYPRSGDGKGAVSTNGDIAVFGVHDGWAFIRYEIDEDRARFGWIDASVLPENAVIGELPLYNRQAVIDQDCAMTDDPGGSRVPIASLSTGTRVELLTEAFHWYYLRVQTPDGPICGFAPEESVLAYADTPPEQVLADIAQRWPGCWLENYALVPDTPDGDYGFALVRSGETRILAGYLHEGDEMRFLDASTAAVPQGDGPGRLRPISAGETIFSSDCEIIPDAPAFLVAYTVPDSENGTRGVLYRWTADGFQLMGWYDDPAFYGHVYIEGDRLSFRSDGVDRVAYAPNPLPALHLWETDYESLPKRLEDVGGTWDSSEME